MVDLFVESASHYFGYSDESTMMSGVDHDGTAWGGQREANIKWISQIAHVCHWQTNTFMVAVSILDEHFVRVPEDALVPSLVTKLVVAAAYSAASLVETADDRTVPPLSLFLRYLPNCKFCPREIGALQCRLMMESEKSFGDTTSFDLLVMYFRALKQSNNWSNIYCSLVKAGVAGAVFHKALDMICANMIVGVDLTTPPAHMVSCCFLVALTRMSNGLDLATKVVIRDQGLDLIESICGVQRHEVKPVFAVAQGLFGAAHSDQDSNCRSRDMKVVSTHVHREITGC